MANTNSHIFRFYDTETSGTNHQFDQIYQFAGVSTDADLNIIKGTEENIICKPRLDVIPHPKAFLTHKLDIDVLEHHGISEFELAKKIQSGFMHRPGVVVSGYNTLKFDDNMVRHLLYRNMLSPYDHEWKDGNRRFDVMKLVQMIYAFRPELLSWKKKDDGKDSMRLSDLSEVNGIVHENAHDALSDVYATIQLAKIIKEGNERAFQYLFSLCDKSKVMSILSNKEPLLFVSSFFGTDKRNTSLILPIVMDVSNKNKMLCVDLRHDPMEMLSMSSDEIRKYLFTKREDLPEGAPCVPALGIESNKLPVLVETKGMLNNSVIDGARLDIDQCYRNAQIVKNDKDFVRRLQAAFVADMPKHKNPYAQLYTGGFFSKEDTSARSSLHFPANDTPPKTPRIKNTDVYGFAMKTSDVIRQFDLVLRCKWNNFYNDVLSANSFSPSEYNEWVAYLNDRLHNENNNSGMTIDEFRKEIQMTRIEMFLDEDDTAILNKLDAYVDRLENKINEFLLLSKELNDSIEIEKTLNPAISKFSAFCERQHKQDKDNDNDNEMIVPAI